MNYNPNKQYTWNPEDKFEISGAEFGLFLNTIRALLNTPIAETIFMAERANNIIEKIMKEGVEKDIIKELTTKENTNVSPE